MKEPWGKAYVILHIPYFQGCSHFLTTLFYSNPVLGQSIKYQWQEQKDEEGERLGLAKSRGQDTGKYKSRA